MITTNSVAAWQRIGPMWTISLFLLTNIAFADEISFGPLDIPTTFYISKSSNRNRVDFALALDKGCIPRGSHPVFSYWRNLEEGPNKLSPLKDFEHKAYGIIEQKVVTQSKKNADQKKSVVQLKLRAISDRAITFEITQTKKGCTVEPSTLIEGKPARLDHVFAHVSGLLNASVDYIELHGIAANGKASVVERIKSP